MNSTLEVLTIEKRKILIKEFKKSFANKDFHSYHDEKYGTKIKGFFNLNVFVFYALLRDQNPKKVTHSKKSEKYENIKSDYFKIRNAEKFNKFNLEYKILNRIMPSLDKDEFQKIVNLKVSYL